MRRSMWLTSVTAVLMLVSVAMTGCSQATTTSPPTKAQVQQQATQTKTTVDEALKTAQAKASELTTVAALLEASGVQLPVSSDVQQIQAKLSSAVSAAQDKKAAALGDVSDALTALIAKVEAAAAKLPAGGQAQTKLADLATKLKDVQTSVEQAKSSSVTPTP